MHMIAEKLLYKTYTFGDDLCLSNDGVLRYKEGDEIINFIFLFFMFMLKSLTLIELIYENNIITAFRFL